MYLNVNNNVDVHEWCTYTRNGETGGWGGKKNTSFRFSERGVSSVSGGEEEGWGEEKKGKYNIPRKKRRRRVKVFLSPLALQIRTRAERIAHGARDGQCAQGTGG